MSIFDELAEIERKKSSGSTYPLNLHNATYHLCMEDRYLSAFTELWMSCYKPFPFTMRDASRGVDGSIVVSITDKDGEMIEFIMKAVTRTSARVHVSKKA